MLGDGTDVVTELIVPNFLDHFPALQLIHRRMERHVDEEAVPCDVKTGNGGEYHERARLGDDMVEQHLFVLRLGHRHPLALECEVADVVAREEHCEVLPKFELTGHGTPRELVFDNEYLSTTTILREHLSFMSTTSILPLSPIPTTLSLLGYPRYRNDVCICHPQKNSIVH